MTQKYWVSLFCAIVIAFGLANYPVCGANADSDQTISHDESVSTSTAASTSDLSQSLRRQKVILVVRINVPHNVRAMNSCRVYPYPVAPPNKKKEIKPIFTKITSLQEQLRALGYTNLTKIDKPYPTGGWRMQYAFRAALAKTGLGVPHTVLTMYPWTEEMAPYLRNEILRINEIEKQRQQRYQAAQQMFEEHRSDLEVEAFNDGLFPHDVPLHPWHGDKKFGKVELEKTNWWIVALHKTPGLQYYWLWPVKLSDAPEQLVELNEDNAIHIEGCW